ncbi:hypothetical protein [Nocardioides sp. T2.26MG-1]|uniref:hypothetical protein n=1 Tax=Nocardioides sp. T2.26MG-1 TaxID=3041166 RepID=UPI0024775BAA|nr:hypothetical protein [Nocardioides sp. T2.26MG-1]CAI9404671.1 hypothetical protein HIDPHFAB_04227 [Nocardioides sp. T2.26MG-1]
MRSTVHTLAAWSTALVVLLASACAPQAPDHSSWTDQARQALEDTASEVATVGLLLRLEQEGKVPGKYQQVVAQDSESAVGAIMAKLGGEQPVPGDDATYQRVTSLMSDASDLLSEVRIAVVRRDTDRYPRLLDALDRLGRKITDTAEGLP